MGLPKFLIPLVAGYSLQTLLLPSGIALLLFAAYFALVTSIDEGPRCLNDCAASLSLYYNEVYGVCAVLAVVGSVNVGYALFVRTQK